MEKVIEDAIDKFKSTTTAMFKASQKNKPLFNLTKEQVDRLIKIKKDQKLIIVASDKGLGPAVMEIEHYIFLAQNHHLNNKNNYKELTKNKARIINHTNFLWICEQFIDRKKTLQKIIIIILANWNIIFSFNHSVETEMLTILFPLNPIYNSLTFIFYPRYIKTLITLVINPQDQL